MAVRPPAAADGGGGPAGAGGDRSGRPRLQPGPGPEPDHRLPDRHYGAGAVAASPLSRRSFPIRFAGPLLPLPLRACEYEGRDPSPVAAFSFEPFTTS